MVKADKDGDIMIEKETSKIGWNFDNSYARLPKTFYTRLEPTPVQAPKLVIKNDSLAEALGLNPLALDTKEGISVLSGNDVPEGATPIAQAYAGHQFGHFTMLGDGRAILLGEQITPRGKGSIFSSRVLESHPIPGEEMAEPLWDQCFGNTL